MPRPPYEATIPPVIMRQLTADNVSDLIPYTDSGNDSFPIPGDDQEAHYFARWATRDRAHGISDLFNAYDANNSSQLVGGGQIYKDGEIGRVGLWVVKQYRQRGYGKSIIHSLEAMAAIHFPEFEIIEMEIKKDNIGSLALASSMGYIRTFDNDLSDRVILAKSLRQ